MLSLREPTHVTRPLAYRYCLRRHVHLDDVRDLWSRSVAECQRRFGTYRVRREVSHSFGADYSSLVISARTEVGLVLNAIFHRAIPREWLESVTEVAQPMRQAA